MNLQLLLFHLAERRCALRRTAVREILPLPHLWRPPGLPRPLAGFLNFGGLAVPVLALDRLFGLDQAPSEAAAPDLYAHLILSNDLGTKGLTALLVDRVADLVSVPSRRLLPVSGDKTLNGCVEAEIDLDGGLVHLLAAERILLAQEQRALSDLGRRASERLSEWTGA